MMYVKNKVEFVPHLYLPTADLLLIYSLLMNSDSVCRILRHSLGHHAGLISHYHRAWVPTEIFLGGGANQKSLLPPIKDKSLPLLASIPLNAPQASGVVGGGGGAFPLEW